MRYWPWAAFAAFCSLATPSPAQSATEKILSSFSGGQMGDTPLAGLVKDKNGNLYGTSSQLFTHRGQYRWGTVYEIQSPGGKATRNILWNFGQIAGDGQYPSAPLIVDSKGVLYGTTGGGGGSQTGAGTVFALTPPSQVGGSWTEAILYSFQNRGDGTDPIGGLLFGPHGTLYGTTADGGPELSGTVFMLSPPAKGQKNWSLTNLYSFQGGADGADPQTSLISDASGSLYGVTMFGGAFNDGTVFKLTPPAQGQTTWTESIIYTFTGSIIDGANPQCILAFGPDGTLYGTTGAAGSGVAFSLSPPSSGTGPWTETAIYQATGSDPRQYTGNTILRPDGSIVFSAQTGGPYRRGGIIQLLPPNGSLGWQENIIYSFGSNQYDIDDGSEPVGILMNAAGTIYGATEFGGKKNKGTVFRISK